MLMRKPICLLLALGLAGLEGCAQFAWIKDGATQQEAKRDTYTCLKEAQRSPSSAQVSMYGGFAQYTVITDPGSYDTCMAAHGYSRRQTMVSGSEYIQTETSPR